MLLILMVLMAAAFRLVQSSPVFSILSNVTPVGAIAIFGGVYFADRWKAFIVPLAALWLSDLFLNRMYYSDHWMFFYSGMVWTYGSFAAMVLIGMLIRKPTFTNVAVAAVGAALTHWVISDMGVFLFGTDITTGLPFTKDFSGFAKCLGLAIPFLRNMAVGNLVFCGVLFGSFEWMQRRYPALSR
jgi:hypothetical protein